MSSHPLHIIFCADPLDPKQPDSMYLAEVSAVEKLGIEYSLISFEDLVAGKASWAVQRVRTQDSESSGVYRGWMLKPEFYKNLFDALGERGIRLVNSPESYRHCHYLPESYSIIEGRTPLSMWIKTDTIPSADTLQELMRPFNTEAIILKDYVKSQKHYWHEACYIPNASDYAHVERVVRRFLELQADDLNEGLVFREFVEFEPLTAHHKSGMPLSKEYRIFYLDGVPIYSTEYWEQGDYQSLRPPLADFDQVAQEVRSRFFTMDVAKRLNGEWMIVELGDAQVSGLPERADPSEFYGALLKGLSRF